MSGGDELPAKELIGRRFRSDLRCCRPPKLTRSGVLAGPMAKDGGGPSWRMIMVCRALGFAAVLLLICGGLARPVQAQENLDAGKSPSQLFAGTCSACHKSPRGLLKTVPAGSLPGFLRQHYTTG